MANNVVNKLIVDGSASEMDKFINMFTENGTINFQLDFNKIVPLEDEAMADKWGACVFNNDRNTILSNYEVNGTSHFEVAFISKWKVPEKALNALVKKFWTLKFKCESTDLEWKSVMIIGKNNDARFSYAQFTHEDYEQFIKEMN